MMSQIGRLAYKIELRIQIDNEDFMHGTNQYEFKMDGQDEGREDRKACFKRLRKRRLGESKETDTSQSTEDPRVMESSMLKSVIIWRMEVTCESKMDFILI